MNMRGRLIAFVLSFLLVMPLQAQTYRTDASPTAAMDAFGGTVAVAGSTVFVGEPANTYSPGMVYVYRPEGETWTVQAELTASDAENGDAFGQALAAEDDAVLIGATGSGAGPGKAYLFQRNNDSWAEVARFTSAGILADDDFGSAVSLDGSVALVGAPGQNGNAGAVYVFRHDAATGVWAEEAQLTGSGVQGNALFGSALALRGNMAFVGAPGQGSGVVYVFQYDDAVRKWTEVAQLTGSEAGEEDHFGSALALKGNDLLVGAPRHSSAIGAVYSFRRDDGSNGWTEQARVMPPDGAPQHRFGTSLAVNGNEVWVGAPGAARYTGTIYLYGAVPENAAWPEPVQLQTNEVYNFGFFASALDAKGDIAAAGIVGADYGAGRAVIFRKNPETGAWQEQNTLLSEPRGLTSITGERVPCTGGEAAAFDCKNVDLVSFLSIQDLGGGRGVRLNDVWGWTDPETGKEYAIVGRVDGTAFVDVSDPANPRFLGDLPMTEGSRGSTWRDMKVYKDHVFIVADNAGEHGMQVFDLTQLRSANGTPPQRFSESAHYDRINSAHNIVINTETGFAYTVGNSGGGETCGGGLHMIDIRDPLHPKFAGCFSDPNTGRIGTGYTHDAQCILYAGPDEEHRGREICFGSNETALSIADVTDKSNPVALSSASYPNVSYTHQGWITEDHRYFYVNDELDELDGGTPQTRTLIWDVMDLDDPQLVKEYTFGTESSDHNLYVRGSYMYQSNYGSGLRIHDISDPENPVEVGYFDTTPIGGNGPGFDGSWSNYPFFESGVIAVSSIGEGLFLVKKSDPEL